MDYMSDRRKLVVNERAKLTATYVNGLAIAVFAVGGLAPLIATAGTISNFTFSAGVATFNIHFSGAAAFASFVCFGVSGILHWAARRSLEALRP